jgi:hypothetical protein
LNSEGPGGAGPRVLPGRRRIVYGDAGSPSGGQSDVKRIEEQDGSPGKTEDGNVLTLNVKTRDRVLFGKYAGTEIKLDGEEPLILREEDILGVIEG